jgi:hypothetical protein
MPGNLHLELTIRYKIWNHDEKMKKWSPVYENNEYKFRLTEKPLRLLIK